MGLLDSVLGAVLGGQQNNQQQAGAGGMNLTALLPVLMPIVTSMLANNGSQGGLGGLASKFNQAGMGDVMNSWIGTGQNQPADSNLKCNT